MKFLLPLILFIALSIFLAIGLKLNPREIPSPLIGKPAPAFNLPILAEPTKTLSPDDLKGRVWLLNVWASWCISCREEHPVLLELARQQQAPLIGLNYKDQSTDAKLWLDQHGNPYRASLMDGEGRVGIEFGVYGVPETFVIDKRGVIRYKHTGPVDANDLSTIFLPLLTTLEAEPA